MHTSLPHRLAAVWFADIVGYGRLTSSNEDDTLRLVRIFQRACRQVVRRHDGRLVKFTGDGALAEFSSTESAVRAACGLEPTFRRVAEGSDFSAPPLHIGIHLGEVASSPDGDLYGEGVNLAARLQGLAEAGQVLVSEDVRRQLHHRPEFRFEPLGDRMTKDSDQAVPVFRVVTEPLAAAETLEESVRAQWRALHGELVRRRVYRVVAIYATGAALAVAAAAVAVPRLGGPGWIVRIVALVSILALPLAVLLAWTFEVGRGGYRRYGSPYEQPGAARRVRAVFAALVLAVVATAGAGAFGGFSGGPATGGGAPLPAHRVAVLYFEAFSPGGFQQFLVDGLTDLLIQELGRVPGLEVISRNGVKPYKGTDVPPDSIARALGAGTLVQGTVAESENQLRLTVQLIDGSTGTLIESQTLNRPSGELFALQEDLVQQVAEFLRRRLGREIRLTELRAGTESVAAWELVQRATRFREEAEPLVKAGALDEAGRIYDRADALLVRAQAADPGWVQPVVQRGWLAYERARWSRYSDGEAFRRWNDAGLRLAELALRISPGDADALDLRGSLRAYRAVYGDPARADAERRNAEQDLRAAVEANPEKAGAWSRLSWMLASRGEAREANLAAERAYRADAYLELDNEIVWRLFAMSYDLNQPAEAERWCLEGERRFPEQASFIACRIWLMTMPPVPADPNRAWSLLEDYDRLVAPQDVKSRKYARMAVAAVLARAGLPDSALAVAVGARADERVDPARELMYFEAFVRTLAGREAEAVGLLAASLRGAGQLSEAAQTWYFCDLHDRPDFRALVGVPRPEICR